jgi:type VI secretion system secreted protein VgrG
VERWAGGDVEMALFDDGQADPGGARDVEEGLAKDGRYLTLKTAVDQEEETFVLTDVDGEDGISMLFFYRLKMFSSNESVPLDNVLGKGATITITLADGSSRFINGIITRIEFSHFDDRENLAYYEAELRPWLWLLTLSGDCRIFQDMTVPEIVAQVCKDAGYAYTKNAVVKEYDQREYCVQYGESDFNFISRLLEREGIFYFFRHADGQHDLVFSDDASVFDPCPSVKTLHYRPFVSDDTEDDVLRTISYERRVASKSIGVESFNFETPSTNLYSVSQGSAGIGAQSFYSGDFLTSKDGEGYAAILLQAAQAPAELLRGSGQARTLVVGGTFDLADHPRQDLNQTYVLRRVRIAAERTRYRAYFDAFRSAIQFRPPATARLPRLHSSQTAIVVGKQGEEIWVDKYGRIKVQFHWDRVGANDEKSSCWIRVAQSWAGKSFGNVFVPRVGQEVVVSFLEGDPDRPIVTGAVYNGDQTIPFDMTTEATKSGIKTQSSKQGNGKFNQVRFEDKKDSEEIYVHAQKDMNLDILNNYTGNVFGNYTLNVKIGTDDQGSKKGGARSVLVEAKESNTNKDAYTHSFEKTRDLTVSGAESHSNKDAFSHTVSKDYTLKVDGNLTISVTGDVTLKGKSLLFESTSAGVTIKSATDTALKAGTELKAESGTAASLQSGTDLSIKSGMGMTLKSTLALSAQGLSTTIKGDTTGEVSAGAMLTLKGALTQIN